MKMANAIILYKIQGIEVLITPLQWRIIKTLEKHPKGIIRGLNNEKGSLMKLLNTARTTIYDNLTTLEKQKIVERSTKFKGERGRPPKVWKLKNNEKTQ